MNLQTGLSQHKQSALDEMWAAAAAADVAAQQALPPNQQTQQQSRTQLVVLAHCQLRACSTSLSLHPRLLRLCKAKSSRPWVLALTEHPPRLGRKLCPAVWDSNSTCKSKACRIWRYTISYEPTTLLDFVARKSTTLLNAPSRQTLYMHSHRSAMPAGGCAFLAVQCMPCQWR